MSKCRLTVSLTPSEVMDKIKGQEGADLVYEEFHDIGEGKYCGTLIFEKYFVRVSNRAALIVLINNLDGTTQVTSIATGSSQGIIFNFDWGAANSFAGSIKNILENYIVKEINE